MTTLLLVRHGETDWNRELRFQGQSDPPLNELGRRQAFELADRLAEEEIAAIYCSDLRRAHETARAVADRLGLEVTIMPELREIDVGSWAGFTRDEIADRFPDGFRRWLEGEQGHDGESREVLAVRVREIALRIAAAHPGEQVLLVSHGVALRTLLNQAQGGLSEYGLDHCAVSRIAVEGDEFRSVD